MYVILKLPFEFITLQTLPNLKIIYLRILKGCIFHTLSLLCTKMSTLYFFLPVSFFLCYPAFPHYFVLDVSI